jgi:hypothetical protein
MTYVVRCDGDPLRLAPALRRAVASVDPNVPAYELRTQLEQIATALRRERLFASVISGFALLTLVLAGLGVYGTLAYLVARRDRGDRRPPGARRTARRHRAAGADRSQRAGAARDRDRPVGGGRRRRPGAQACCFSWCRRTPRPT